MLLKADNRVLVKDQPTTILTAAVSAGGTALTVANNEGFSQNDFVLPGKIADEKSEIKRITAAVSAGASLTVAALTFSHDENTPLTKLDYDQVEFSYSATSTGAKTVLATKAIDPTGIYTYWEDTVYTTGYGFVRYKDSNTSTYSAYSDAIPYTGYTEKMLRSIRNKVRRLIRETDEQNSPISNDEIDDEINLSQKEIAHDRLWSFYEKIKSFSTVANKYQYSLASDVFTLYEAAFDTQPLLPITLHEWNKSRWDSDTTGDPTHLAMWRRAAYVYPYPSSGADSTTINDADGITDSDTTITVASTSGFEVQGRIIIGSEVISYTGTTSTTFTGCVRGEEGTTAASHSNGATVTKRDVIYHFQEEPSDLSNETDETLIPEPSIIAYKVGAELSLGLEKDLLHDRLMKKYEIGMAQLRKVDEPKIKSVFGRVKESFDRRNFRNPNDFPQNINL